MIVAKFPAAAVLAAALVPAAHVAAAEPGWATGSACVDRGLRLVKGDHALGAIRKEYAVGGVSVRFDRDVTRCVYVATIGRCGNAGSEAPGFIVAERRVDDPNAVWVETRNPRLDFDDRAFDLVVACPAG